MCGKVVSIEQYRKLEDIPREGKQPYREQIITPEMGFKAMGGIFASFLPGGSADYHYHTYQEHILIVISGEGTRTIDGKVYKIKAGDIVMTTANEKHDIQNTGTSELRYLQFSAPTSQRDNIKAEEKK